MEISMDKEYATRIGQEVRIIDIDDKIRGYEFPVTAAITTTITGKAVDTHSRYKLNGESRYGSESDNLVEINFLKIEDEIIVTRMKIKVGRRYKTREGHDVRVLAIDLVDAFDQYPCLVAVKNRRDGKDGKPLGETIKRCRTDGRSMESFGSYNPHDLIEVPDVK